MITHTPINKDLTKIESVSNSTEQSVQSKSVFQLQDNRPQFAVQKKQAEALANKGSVPIKLWPATIQLSSRGKTLNLGTDANMLSGSSVKKRVPAQVVKPVPAVRRSDRKKPVAKPEEQDEDMEQAPDLEIPVDSDVNMPEVSVSHNLRRTPARDKAVKPAPAPAPAAKRKHVSPKEDAEMHGLPFPRPKPYENIYQEDAHPLGHTIATELPQNLKELETQIKKYGELEKEMRKKKEVAGIKGQSNDKVNVAVDAAFKKNKRSYASNYRNADGKMDEHLGTTLVFHILSEAADQIEKIKDPKIKVKQKELIKAATLVVSHFRMPTNSTGYNTKEDKFQHPCAKPMFTVANTNHSFPDRMRASIATEEGSNSSETGAGRYVKAAVRASVFSSNSMVAPPFGPGINMNKKVTEEDKKMAHVHREVTKDIGGLADPSAAPKGNQEIDAPWKPADGMTSLCYSPPRESKRRKKAKQQS